MKISSIFSPRRPAPQISRPDILELLEARIAPASGFFHVSPDGHSAFYDDVDGDHVTVKITAGIIPNQAPPGATLGVEAGPLGNGSGYLRFLDFSSPNFNHTNITVSVVKVPGGDGLANVGAIFGGTNDFGTIVVKGDLGRIVAGSSTPGTPAIKSLIVRSMGRFGVDTQMTDGGDKPPGADYFVSTIVGGLGALKVAGDVKDVWVNVIGGSGIGTVSIGGSLIGGNANPIPAVGIDTDVTEGGVLATRAAEDLDAHDPLRAAVVGHVEVGGDLNHD